MSVEKKLAHFHMRLEPSLLDKLDDLAKKTHSTRSEIVHKFIIEGLMKDW